MVLIGYLCSTFPNRHATVFGSSVCLWLHPLVHVKSSSNSFLKSRRLADKFSVFDNPILGVFVIGSPLAFLEYLKVYLHQKPSAYSIAALSSVRQVVVTIQKVGQFSNM